MRRSFWCHAACLFLTLMLAGCDQGTVTEPPEEPIPPSPGITYRVEGVGAIPVGFEQQFSVYGYPTYGPPHRVSGVQWSVGESTIAEVDSGGVVKAIRGSGAVRLVATIGSVTKFYPITVFALQGRLALEFHHDYLGEESEIVVVPLDGGQPTRFGIIDGVGDRAPSWSPDGTRLAFFCQGSGLCVSAANGSDRRVLGTADHGDPGGPRWSADGMSVLYSNMGAIWSVGLEGDPPVQILLPGLGPFSSPSESPDGSLLAFRREHPTEGLCVLRVGGAVSWCRPDASLPVWDPNSSLLAAFLPTEPYDDLPYSLGILTLGGGLWNHVRPPNSSETGGSPASWSPDGKRLAIATGGATSPREIWVVPLEEGSGALLVPARLSFGRGRATAPSWGR